MRSDPLNFIPASTPSDVPGSNMLDHTACERQLAAANEAKETAEKTWRCFNCGFETQDRAEALAHFGDRDEGESLCITWDDLNVDGRAQEYQSRVEERNATEEENTKLRQENEALEDRLGGIEGEIASRFKGCRTVNDAFNLYDSMEGRALASEERAETAEAQVGKLAEALEEIATTIEEGSKGMRKLAYGALHSIPSDLLAEYRKHVEDSELLDLSEQVGVRPQISSEGWKVFVPRKGMPGVWVTGATLRDALRAARGKQ
jgi:hypothetical protein